MKVIYFKLKIFLKRVKICFNLYKIIHSSLKKKTAKTKFLKTYNENNPSYFSTQKENRAIKQILAKKMTNEYIKKNW